MEFVAITKQYKLGNSFGMRGLIWANVKTDAANYVRKQIESRLWVKGQNPW